MAAFSLFPSVGQQVSRLPVPAKQGSSRGSAHRAYAQEAERIGCARSSRIPRPVTAPVKIRTLPLGNPSYMHATRASAARTAIRAVRTSRATNLGPRQPIPPPTSRPRAYVKPRAPVFETPSAVPAVVNPFDGTASSSSSSPSESPAAVPTTQSQLPTIDEALWLWDVENPLPSARQFATEKSAWFVHRALHEVERERYVEEMKERIAAAAMELACKSMSSLQ